MIAIVIPAHNEEEVIGIGIRAALVAAIDPRLEGEEVALFVVLDSCGDATAQIAAREGARTLSVCASNVGLARAMGADAAIALGARWLAFTDADTVVSPTWLADQLSLEADAVCGSVGVDDWSPHGIYASLLHAHFLRTYMDADGHRHVHGANLGVSAAAYRRAGGFRHLACHEDVDFVRALEAAGARIAWSAKPRVVTSARRHARAQGGFADALVHAMAPHLPIVSEPLGP